MKQLVACMGIQSGITTFIGGGGKTSSIFQVARELKEQNKRVIVTTTTKMYYPDKEQVETVLINPSEAEIREAVARENVIAIASSHSQGKISGVSDEQIQIMEKLADYILVEGDGSKHLPIKVHKDYEPVIPNAAQKVVIVVGMKALNAEIENVCFRKEEAVALLGKPKHHLMTASDMATIITSPQGLQKGIGHREQMLLVNQIDVVENQETIKETIKMIKDKYVHKIVIAALNKKCWQEA